MNRAPDWFRVLKFAIDNRLVDYGLSFSFLVGATRNPIGTLIDDNQQAKSEAEALFEVIKEPYGDWIANFDNCMNEKKVGGIVITLVHRNAYFEHPSFEAIWHEYGPAICAGTFSKNGSFHKFSEDEIIWIKKALDAKDQ
jgi:hypothetical protein